MSLEIYRQFVPEGFEFPKEFIFGAETDTDISPWRYFVRDNSFDCFAWFRFLKERYPTADLIPFAYINDPSGFWVEWPVIACFDPDEDNRVRIYSGEVSSSSPWRNRSYLTFDDWLEAAKSESNTYKKEITELHSSQDSQLD